MIIGSGHTRLSNLDSMVDSVVVFVITVNKAGRGSVIIRLNRDTLHSKEHFLEYALSRSDTI